MTTYDHPEGVQLINCDCPSCTSASSMFIRTWGGAANLSAANLSVGEICAAKLCMPPQPVPNRLYGAEINHEGDAI